MNIPDVIYIHVIMYISHCFHCSDKTFIPGQDPKKQTFRNSLVSVNSMEKGIRIKEQVQEYCNSRKEALLRL